MSNIIEKQKNHSKEEEKRNLAIKESIYFRILDLKNYRF